MNQLRIFLDVLNVNIRGVKDKYIFHYNLKKYILCRPTVLNVKEQFHENSTQN